MHSCWEVVKKNFQLACADKFWPSVHPQEERFAQRPQDPEHFSHYQKHHQNRGFWHLEGIKQNVFIFNSLDVTNGLVIVPYYDNSEPWSKVIFRYEG